MMHTESTRPRKSPRRIVGEAAMGLAVLMCVLAMLERNLRIGIVQQDIVCLPGISVIAYMLDAVLPARGDIYAFYPPDMVHDLGIFPTDIVFVKRAVAVPGDEVTISALDGIIVNGTTVAEGLPLAARLGMTIAELERSFIVEAGHVLMMGETPNSIDGRYFGTIRVDLHGIGKGWALW